MPSLLSLKNISFQANKNRILNNISLDFEKEERTSLSGISGSGKSTLLKIMASLLQPTSGTIEYNGQNIQELEYTTYRKKVSYVYQTPSLFGQTVKDNLAFPAEIRKDSFDEGKAKSYLAELGLDYIPLDKNIHSLSGGEKQRVSLIRHLMYPPEVLLLDEVTSAIDDQGSETIWDWIFKHADKENITLIWISHKTYEQQMADRKVIVANGQIAGEEK